MSSFGSDPSQNSAEELCLPILDLVAAQGLVVEAVDHALAERKGVLLVGDKGVGKTVALREALESLEESERRKESLDPTYQRRYVLRLGNLKDKRAREVVVNLLTRFTGETSHKARGVPKSDDTLRGELVQCLLDERYGLIVVDEAEWLAPDVITLLRDLLSDTEGLSPTRYRTASATDSRAGIAAAGVGILLVGTPQIRARIEATNEVERRWVRVITAPPLPAALAPEVYLQWMPGFASHVAKVSAHAWANYVSSLVTNGQPTTIDRLERHVRLFYRVLVRNGRTKYRETTRFNTEAFERTAAATRWGHDDHGHMGVEGAA